jgi:hypothetical protein
MNYIEQLKATFEEKKQEADKISNEVNNIYHLRDNLSDIRNYLGYCKTYITRLNQFNSNAQYTLPEPLIEVLDALNNINLDQAYLDDMRTQMDSLRNKQPNLGLIGNIIQHSETIGLVNDTFEFTERIRIEMNKTPLTTSYIKPSNFKNNLIPQDEKSKLDFYWPHFYEFYKLEEGATRKVEKVIVYNLSKSLKAFVCYLLDLRTNMRTRYILKDTDEEATVELHMWIKNTDLYQPITKMPNIKREELIEAISNSYLN